MIIDAPTHTLCPAVTGALGGPPGRALIPRQRDMSDESRAVDAARGAAPGRRFNDATRSAVMAQVGVDFQIVAPAPGQQHYWAGAEALGGHLAAAERP